MLNPLRDLLVVKRDEVVSQTSSGIIIKTGTVDVPDKGKVLAAGPGKYVNDKFVSNPVKPGDYVLFGKNAGTAVMHEGEELFIMRSDEVFAILT